MAEQEQNTEQNDQEQPTSATPAEAQNTETGPKPVPYDRFKEVNDRVRAAEAELAQYQREKAEREQAEALARGEHEKVIASLEPKAARAAELEATLKGYLQAELEDIPEESRDLVPEFDGDVAKQLEFVKKAKSRGLFEPKGQTRRAPSLDGGAGTGQPIEGEPLTDFERDVARRLPGGEEEYRKYKKRRG